MTNRNWVWSICVFVTVLQSLSCVQLFATPRTAVCQASLSFTISRSLLKLMSVESVIPSSHPILRCSLLLLPSIFPSIRVFSNESALWIRWPKYWNFSFSISPPMNIQGWFPLGLTGLILLSKGLSRVFSSTAVRSINSSVLSLLILYMSIQYTCTVYSILSLQRFHESNSILK